MDREKVIKGLEELSGFLFKEYGKAQAEETSLYYDEFLTVDGAISLLKEQEAVEPVECNVPGILQCGSCGASVMRELGYRFRNCPWCGVKIKWD